MRFLILSRDERLLTPLCADLTGIGFEYDHVTEEECLPDNPAGEVCDVMLLDLDENSTLLSRLRGEGIRTPCMVLLPQDNPHSRIDMLEQGADDCLSRPFCYDELLVRLKVLTRRLVMTPVDTMTFADLSLHAVDMTLRCTYRVEKLSHREFDVMRFLMLNSHSIVRKEVLLSRIWGGDSEAVYNNVEAYISLLRKKLFRLSSGVMIETVRGVGYQLIFRQPT